MVARMSDVIEAAQLDVAAVVTAGRPMYLARCLQSIGAHARSSIPLLVLVVDGSDDASAVRRNQAAVRAAARTSPAVFRYIGAAEVELLRRCLQKADAPASVIRRTTSLGSIGCGRNIALLLAFGAPVVMVDDDVILRTWV